MKFKIPKLKVKVPKVVRKAGKSIPGAWGWGRTKLRRK